MFVAPRKVKVIENMGFSHAIGAYAKAVLTEDGEERVIVGRKGHWRFWGASDRVERYVRTK